MRDRENRTKVHRWSIIQEIEGRQVSKRERDASKEGETKSRTTVLASFFKHGIPREINDDQQDQTDFPSHLKDICGYWEVIE